MGKERRILNPYFLPEITTLPPSPKGLTIDDVVKQTLALMIGLRNDELRILKVDELDRLLVTTLGQEATHVQMRHFVNTPPWVGPPYVPPARTISLNVYHDVGWVEWEVYCHGVPGDHGPWWTFAGGIYRCDFDNITRIMPQANDPVTGVASLATLGVVWAWYIV